MFSGLISSRQSIYRRKFLENTDENLFMGSFDGFAAAEAAVPSSKPVGYDHAATAKPLYSHQIYFYDYPALFWLAQSLAEGHTKVFDLGGHVGIKYYAFRRVLSYPDALRWTVCDVPAVVRTGRELAAERKVADKLDFTSEFGDGSGCDVLYASGSLQYLNVRIGNIVGGYAVKPKRIILNTTAVHPDKTLYTLNSIGFAVCPYRIQHHDELLAEIQKCGYKRRDSWRNEGKPITVPFVEGGDKPYYSGCCYDLVR